MATDIYKDLNLSQDDINGNIELYTTQLIENGSLKMKMAYPNSFFLSNNNNIKYFRLDPYNKGKVNYFTDIASGATIYIPENKCFPALLQNMTGKTRYNNSNASFCSNNIMTYGYTWASVVFEGLSSIICLGFNDIRAKNTYMLYREVEGFRYQKMILDLIVSMSIPSANVIRARDMIVKSGTWLTTTSITGLDYYTNTNLANLEYTFTNKRYIYISFIYKTGNTNAQWNIYVNDSSIATEQTYVVPSFSGSLYITSGFIVDLGSVLPSVKLNIEYQPPVAEYNYVNYVAGWTDDEINFGGRDVLMIAPPRISASYLTDPEFNFLTDEKRTNIINCQKEAVKMAKMCGLNCYYFEPSSILPVDYDNVNFLPSSHVMIANDIYKYIQLSNKNS